MFGENELEKKVEVTENYIRVRVKDPKLFKKKTFRTVWLSKKDGIKAVMGKLKNPPKDKKGSMTLQSYMFLKTKWTKEEALAWIEEHKKFYEIENNDDFVKSWVKDRQVDGPPEWMLYLSAPYAEKIYTGVWYMVRSIKTKKHIEELLWFCSDMVYGIYWMSYPKEVEVATIEEEIGWDRFTWLTGLTQAEVFNLFGSAEKIYLYEMWGYERFREPMKYKKPEGIELFMKGNPDFIIEPDEDGNMPPEVKGADLDKMSIGEILWLHNTIKTGMDKPEFKEKSLKQIEDSGYKIVDMESTRKSIVEWLAKNQYAGYKIVETKQMVKCSNCDTEFDYDSTVETGMGYVKCPNCELAVIQDGTAYEDGVEKGAIGYHNYGKEDKGVAWDGPAQKAKADVKVLKKICAFYSGDGSKKGDFKLPHHNAESLKSNWNGVKAAMGALKGARGGVDIPAGDKKKVFNHLKRHYVDFGEVAPEFKFIEDNREDDIVLY